MKMYLTLSEAMKAIYARESRQVIGIVSINGDGYFVKRSTISPIETLAINAVRKQCLTKDLQGLFGQAKSGFCKERFNKLTEIMGVNVRMPATQKLHAEENIILSFNEMVRLYSEKNPNKKIKTIDVFLSHAPCTQHIVDGGRKYSGPKKLNGVAMPAGCFNKLDLFFKNQYRASQAEFFADKPKVRVKYSMIFAKESTFEGFHPGDTSRASIKGCFKTGDVKFIWVRDGRT